MSGAALYIRLSREDQREGPSQSVENQKSLLEAYAREHQLPVYDTYVDDGYSGTSFQRPAFQRMLRDIEAGRVELVLTKDLSRLGRDYIGTGHYLERYFPEHGVRYLSLLDGIDTGRDTAANELTPFKAVVNDLYARDISKKIKSVKHDQQRKGEFLGGKAPYGYGLHPGEKHRLVVDGEAAQVVRRVFRLALAGESCRAIADRLNREGVLTPARYAGLTIAKPGPCSGLWSSERISEMLRNEMYLGTMVQGRSARISYKTKKCRRLPPEAWQVVEHTHEALVSREDFDRVQALLASRRHTRRRTYDYPLKGLIFCRECGRPLGVVNRKNAAGEDVLYFVCRTSQRLPGSPCTSHCIRESRVTAAVWEALGTLCRGIVTEEQLLNLARCREEGQSRAAEARRLQRQIDRAYGDHLRGLLQEEDFRRIYGELTAQKQALAAQPEPPAPRALAERFLRWDRPDPAVLTTLLSRVELTADKSLILHLRCKEPLTISPVPSLAH